MTVTVVGLGKIGLPLAVTIARAGQTVHGLDVDPRVVELVNDAEEPFPGEEGLADGLRAVVPHRLVATLDASTAVSQSDVVIMVVPLVVDERGAPVYDMIDAATRTIAPHLRPGVLVSYETTLPVGTTRNRFAAALAAGSGLALGSELLVAHSPERVFSGRIFADLRRYPKLVGGIDEASARTAVDFYSSVLTFDDRPDLPRSNGVWDLGSAEAAELAKLAETSYRDLNIAFANELAVACDGLGIDAHAVIDACNSQPFSHIHRPGISVGGHCIPVYPHFMVTSVPGMALNSLGRTVNEAMPRHAVELLRREIGSLEGLQVLILGLAYRGGVKEHAFSGAFALRDTLQAGGAEPMLHDPLYSVDEIEALGFRAWSDGEHADAVILHTDHDEYRSWTAANVVGVRCAVDGRTLLSRSSWPQLVTLGRGDPRSAS